MAGQVVRQGEPVLLNDPALFEQAQVYQWPTDLTALLAVPLHVNGGVIGVLDVVNKAGGFTEEDVPVMSVFANQAAMAIEHARLQQQAEQLAVLAERQRLARELHDSVTQSLYSVTLYANAAALALAAGKQDVTAGYLQELQETAQEGMRDMRLLIFQLHPPVLETEGLVAAVAGAPGRRRGPRRPANRVPRRGGAAVAHRDRKRAVLDRPGGAQQRAQTCGGPACDRASALHRREPSASKCWMTAWGSIRRQCPPKSGAACAPSPNAPRASAGN